MRLMSLPGGERYSCPLQSLVVSILLSLVSTLIVSRTGSVQSKFFDTQVSSVFIEELGFPCHAHCALSCLRCNEHSLMLSSYLSRIGRVRILLAVPADIPDTRHRTHLISF